MTWSRCIEPMALSESESIFWNIFSDFTVNENISEGDMKWQCLWQWFTAVIGYQKPSRYLPA